MRTATLGDDKNGNAREADMRREYSVRGKCKSAGTNCICKTATLGDDKNGNTREADMRREYGRARQM